MEQNPSSEITVALICDTLGRKTVAASCGVGITQVSNACVDNKFPAKWFSVIRQLCSAAGIACPEHLFNFVAKAS